MIRQRRIELGMSQRRLAQKLNIPASRLSRYESGSRSWPPELMPKLQEILGLCEPIPQDWFLSWKQQLAWSLWQPWQVEVDAGPTWADVQQGYASFYRQLQPRRTPPLEFRRHVRVDTGLEGCAYSALCEGGARPTLASPVILHFPHHPLLNGNGKCMGVARRAALLLSGGWLLFPQITVLVGQVRIRLDGLAFSTLQKRWVGVEFDGPAHQQSDWDARRDAQLDIPVARFRSEEILGGNFCKIFEDRLQRLIT